MNLTLVVVVRGSVTIYGETRLEGGDVGETDTVVVSGSLGEEVTVIGVFEEVEDYVQVQLLGTAGTEDQTGDFVSVVRGRYEDVVLKNISTTGVSYRLDLVNVGDQGNQTTVITVTWADWLVRKILLSLALVMKTGMNTLTLTKKPGRKEVQYSLTAVVLGDVDGGGSQTTTNQQSGVVDVTVFSMQ